MISGFDIEINYAKVAKAVSYLRTPGCLFVSTNTDTGLPCGGSCLLPGMTFSLSADVAVVVLINQQTKTKTQLLCWRWK